MMYISTTGNLSGDTELKVLEDTIQHVSRTVNEVMYGLSFSTVVSELRHALLTLAVPD